MVRKVIDLECLLPPDEQGKPRQYHEQASHRIGYGDPELLPMMSQSDTKLSGVESVSRARRWVNRAGRLNGGFMPKLCARSNNPKNVVTGGACVPFIGYPRTVPLHERIEPREGQLQMRGRDLVDAVLLQYLDQLRVHRGVAGRQLRGERDVLMERLGALGEHPVDLRVRRPAVGVAGATDRRYQGGGDGRNCQNPAQHDHGLSPGPSNTCDRPPR